MALKLKKEEDDFVDFSKGSCSLRFEAALMQVEQAHRKETAELRTMIENQQIQIDALKRMVSELHEATKKKSNGLSVFAPLRGQIKKEFPGTLPNNENEENSISSGLSETASFDTISKSCARPQFGLKRSTTPPERHASQLKKQSSSSPIHSDNLKPQSIEGKSSPITIKHAIPRRNVSDLTADSDGDSEGTCDDPSGIHIFVNEPDNSNTSSLEDSSESNSNSCGKRGSNKDEAVKKSTLISTGLTLASSNNQMEDTFERIQSMSTKPAANPSSVHITHAKFNSKSRKKEDREAMKASSCAHCDKFYDAISGPNLPADNLKKYCSRHRHDHATPRTPPGFWDVAFDETS